MTANDATAERRSPGWHDILAAIASTLEAKVAALDAALPPPAEAPVVDAGVDPTALLAERLARLDESLARAENRTAAALVLLDQATQELAEWRTRAVEIVARAEGSSGVSPASRVVG